MNNKRKLIFFIALILLTGIVNSIAAQGCPIRQTIAVKTMQTIGITNPNQSGSSSVFSIQNCDEALNAFQEELLLKREAEDPFGEAWVLTQIGDIHFDLKHYKQAFYYYDQALPLFRQMKNIDGEYEILNLLVSVSRSLRNYSESLSYLEEELLIVRAPGNESIRSDEGRILDVIANVYLESSKDAKAFEYFYKRLAFEREHSNDFGEFAAFKALGEAYEAKGKKDEALKSYQNALKLFLKFSRGWQGDLVTDSIKELHETIDRLQQ